MADVLLGIDFFKARVNCSVCVLVGRKISRETFVKVPHLDRELQKYNLNEIE